MTYRKIPFVTGMAYLPKSMVYLDDLRAALTMTVIDNDTQAEDEAWSETIVRNDGTREIQMYDESKPGYIGVPREWAFEQFPEVRFVNRMAWPEPRPDLFPKRITARNEQQDEFMRALLANVRSTRGPVDYVANASTGAGKTVSDLWLTAQIGVPCIVLCHITKIARQWKERAEQHYGQDWCDRYLGWVQRDRCDYQGKLLVIALMPSVARRDYGLDFFRYFGKVTYDECHKVGAPLLSRCLQKFPARVRGGYTATNRKDALQRIINYHLGKPKVKSLQAVQRSVVIVHRFRKRHTLYAASEYSLISGIAKIPERNHLLARIILNGYGRGRQIVALSDRTEQLQDIQRRLVDMGVPADAIGLHVGSYFTGNIVGYVRGAARRTRIGVFRDKREAARAGAVEFEKEKRTVPPDELDRIGQTKQILLATYGIFDTGTDSPRLDFGLECTPRGDVVQALGRILRELPGKPTPEWHAIEDEIWGKVREQSMLLPELWTVYDFFRGKSEARRKSYAAQRAEVREV
jgi:superfamily II DNA or RNA helicase